MRLTGKGAPSSITFNSSSLWFKFTSDWQVQYFGVFIYIEASAIFVPCGEGDYQCESGYGCLESSKVCDNYPQCLDGSDEAGCATCKVSAFSCDLPYGLMCIFPNQICDGESICPDASDEQECGICGVPIIYLPSHDASVNLTSPSYPLYYDSNLHCVWYIHGLEESAKVVVHIQDFEMENGYDFLIFGNGDDSSLRTSAIATLTGTTHLTSLTASQSEMWIKMITDPYIGYKGFRLLIQQTLNTSFVCSSDEFDCGQGFCTDLNARCNGFKDCVINYAEEIDCVDVICPGSYLCDVVADVTLRSCVEMHKVCDGNIDCPAADDESECGKSRLCDGAICTDSQST
ncbi:low-density lipoprotein receptor-related protein 12-like [Amphiura filiformis]|uniref:low-density lipoprotein receptor-related protein 12-like n=1 Tax=Amphiura filiformis TaxID=82378 RepID=UPI003B21D26E